LEPKYVELGGEAEGNQKSKCKNQKYRAKMKILYPAKAQRTDEKMEEGKRDCLTADFADLRRLWGNNWLG